MIGRLFGRGGAEPPAPAAGGGQEVTVWIRGLGRTGGEVVVISGRSAEIALAVDPRFGDDTIDTADAVVEHTAPRGLYRQTGSVWFGARNHVSFTPSQEASLVQRRDYVRLPLHLTVGATLQGAAAERELVAIDVSASGLLLGRTADAPLEEGNTVWLSIQLDDGMPPIAPRGTVVRGAEEGTRGVRFDYITDDDQERLARFVLREQLRLRREGKL
ncbi:MAG TPA: PilZ domain-containing protein [Thermoleophilaceae bacterium]